MGLPTFARAYLKQTYTDAFSFNIHGDPTICVYDLMKDMKYMPEHIVMLDDCILYLVNKIKSIMLSVPTLRVMIVCVDRKPPVVKRMVTHVKRYKNKEVFDSKGGPYLQPKYSSRIPQPWIGFAGNYKLLQRELYPRLFNAFMDGVHIVPKPGQMLVLHGFPGYCEWQTVYKQHTSSINTNERGQVKCVHLWRTDTELPISKEMERDDRDLYNRVYVFENIPPCEQFPQGWMRKEEWVEAKNDISESDGSMFFYDHWFQNETFLLICNDGDVFSYGLLYSYERVIAQNNTFRNNHIVCVPYKKRENEYFAPDQMPRWEYCDMNRLYVLVKEDASMKSAGVQNHIVTLVFLLIMAESDFFKGYMKGLGAEAVIWKVFFANLNMFSHMVQSSKGVTPHTRTPREIVLDEKLFRVFVHYCYIQKYGKAVRKSGNLTYAALHSHTRSGKKGQSDPDYHLPDRNKIRLWARQVEWNLLYYRNTPLGNEHSPDPFETWDGLPYYPYARNPDTGKPEMTEVVAARRKPVDEVYAQHFYDNKRKHAKTSNEPPPAHKQAVMDAYSATKNAQGKRERVAKPNASRK
jgi:hypothetical protein